MQKGYCRYEDFIISSLQMRFLELRGRKCGTEWRSSFPKMGKSSSRWEPSSPLCFVDVCNAPIGKGSGETVPCVSAEILNQQLAQEKVNQAYPAVWGSAHKLL